MPRLIVISSERDLANESTLLEQLLAAGLPTLHLRKPAASQASLQALLDRLDPMFYPRLVLHQHPSLVEKYALGGMHLSETSRQKLSRNELRDLRVRLKAQRQSLSTSVHTPETLATTADDFDYVLYSPVFPSISKPGYAPRRAVRVQGMQITPDIIGLGGVCAENLSQLWTLGYQGAAFLGYVWKDPPRAVHHLKKIQSLWPDTVLTY